MTEPKRLTEDHEKASEILLRYLAQPEVRERIDRHMDGEHGEVSFHFGPETGQIRMAFSLAARV